VDRGRANAAWHGIQRADPQAFGDTVKMLRLIVPMSLSLALGACSVFDAINPWTGKSEDLGQKEDLSKVPVEELYNRGVDALGSSRDKVAVTQFDLVQQNYPYSSWAVNAQLMEGYADYRQSKYTDAIGTLDRFIQLHPAQKDIGYAYYLRALCYYEQIADTQRDQKGTADAMGALQEVVNRFPDSSYARDARLKIDLARDHLAGKEMEVGRWYEDQHLYAAAIGRFQHVVDDYQTTNHVPEALHRLTEIYLKLGLVDQAKKTAAVLGHNYPGSEWYEASYDQLAADGQVQAVPGEAPPPKPGLLARTIGSIF
jgi:outer membrane protein assembly factor BamD